jgi:hypothetical protein
MCDVRTDKMPVAAEPPAVLLVTHGYRYNSQGMPAGPFIADINSGEIVQMLHTIPKVHKIKA